MIEPDDVARLLPDFLPRQRWYGGGEREILRIEMPGFDVLRGSLGDWPMMVWTLAEVAFADGGTARFQVPVGLRPLQATERFLEGKGRQMLGDLDTEAGPVLVYDALVDPDLSLEFFHIVAPGEEVERVRPLVLEQSNTSIVFDERLIMKVFRRVHVGPNPDVEVTEALARVGFEHTAAPVGIWRWDGCDLAVVRQFLAPGTDGWQLALTSLRDMYDLRLHPAECGGDFAPESERLGSITASMHVALAEAFGVEPGNPRRWAQTMRDHLIDVPNEPFDAASVVAVYDKLAQLDDAGAAIRIHGDYHLGQTMRTDEGWYVLDFEGEPILPLDIRRQPSSALRDVAGMLRSFHYATQVGLLERGGEADEELADLAQVWEERVAQAFLEGYDSVEGVDHLLPGSAGARQQVLDAFVVAKAVYEIGYEISHRPDWAQIPLAGLTRQLGGGGAAGWAWAKEQA
ncbi:MAG: maltokinase N-terminal cap-like domain-containing protein [Acidimicrobiales bacterium]